MQFHLAHGLSAAEAARTAIAEAQTLAASTSVTLGSDGSVRSDLHELARSLQRAFDDFDEGAAQTVLDRLLSDFTLATTLRDVVVPYLQQLGERWERGEIGIAQEHFASNVIRGRLAGLARGWGEGQGPRAIVACPPDELHDLPLLIFGIVLNRNGWRVDYFGASTPIDELVRAVGRSRPELVVVAATTTDRFTAILGELAQLAAVAPLALAGAGATQHMADEIGARLLSGDPVTAAQHQRAAVGGERVTDRPTDRPVVPTRPPSRRPSRARRGRSAGAGHPAVRARRCPAPDGRPSPARVPPPHTARAGRQLGTHGAALTLRRGRPEEVVPSVVAETGAAAVHISADFAPYGAQRDERVAAALGEVPLVATGSPYAVAPDQIRKPNGDPYQVFAPFYRSWVASGWDAPARFDRSAVEWLTIAGEAIPDDPSISATLPDAGEIAAHRAWARFRDDGLADYGDRRDHPALDGTSRMSPFLKLGAIHPRTLLHDLGPDDDGFRRQLAWREFYATVLHHAPSTRAELLPAAHGAHGLRPWCRCRSRDSMRGPPVEPGIHSSMRGCASSWSKAGCTTGCG